MKEIQGSKEGWSRRN